MRTFVQQFAVVSLGGVKRGDRIMPKYTIFGDQRGCRSLRVFVEQAVVTDAQSDNDIELCTGLIEFSRLQNRIAHRHADGFTFCGNADLGLGIPKTEVGIPAECEAVGVTMCNPILQARKLNEAGTELNVVVGLCVGHDSLFYKYAEAPTTTLITKDRVLGHNPVAALYTAKTYYSKLLDKSAHNET